MWKNDFWEASKRFFSKVPENIEGSETIDESVAVSSTSEKYSSEIKRLNLEDQIAALESSRLKLERKIEDYKITIAIKERQELSNRLRMANFFGFFKKSHFRILDNSGLFDREWYVKSYPEVANLKQEPLEHFIERGWRELKNPNPFFDTDWYLRVYPDVANAKINPLLHYYLYGEGGVEKRNPGPNFDANDFLEKHPQLIHHKLNGLAYFLRWAEKSADSTDSVSLIGFDAGWYGDMNALGEVAAVEVCEAHFLAQKYASKRKKVAFFGYSWTNTWRLDPYMREMVAAIASLGLDVDVYIGNQFTEDGATKGMRADVNKKVLAKFIKERGYDFAISFNNSLVMSDIVDALQCKIVSVIVDSEHHLFNHLGESDFAPFMLPIHAAPIYTSLVEELDQRRDIRASFSFLPPATQVSGRGFGQSSGRGIIEISWVVSLVGDHNLDTFLSLASENEEALEKLSICLSDIALNSAFSEQPSVKEAISFLCSWASWTEQYLEMQLQNIVTNQRRHEVIERLAKQGLKIFGNNRWRALMPYSSTLASVFTPGRQLRTHSDLCRVYDSSKVSINMPQTQAKSGLQYRVLDVLASSSLLITKEIPDSDLEKVFGKNSPIVTYRDLDDLEEKCRYFLREDEERASRVTACNQLVAKGFSFQERVLEYLSISNRTSAASILSLSHFSGRGCVDLIGIEKVRCYTEARKSRGLE